MYVYASIKFNAPETQCYADDDYLLYKMIVVAVITKSPTSAVN